MKDLRHDLKSFALIYINLLFIIKLMAACFKIDKFSYAFFTAIIIVCIIVYCFYSLILDTIYSKVFVISSIIIVLFIWFYCKEYINHMIYINSKYIVELGNCIHNFQQTFFYQYKFLLMLVIPSLFMVLFFIDKFIYKNFVIFSNIISIIFLWHYGYVQEVRECIPYFILLSIITFISNNYIERKKVFSFIGADRTINFTSILIYTLIISIFAISIQSFLPKREYGKINDYSKRKVFNRFIPNKEDVYNSYSLISSGYNNLNKKLGGPINLNNNEVFRVQCDSPYYLKGSCKDYYDGFSWRISEDNYKSMNKENTLPKPKGSMTFSIEGEGRFKYITIYPTYIKTSTFFSPLYTTELISNGRKVFFNDENNLISSNVVNKSYTVGFYDDSRKYSVISTSVECKKEFMSDLISYEYKKFKGIYPEKKNQYVKYLQIPENISDRVYKLVEDITEDASNPGEKVIKIYEYLNKNYKYSLNVSNIPEGKEFIDYFLFEERKGYCTYFATAATIMCRIAGVPARYIEGFNMPYIKDDKGLYIVTNKNAHAWTEVLISPAGDTWSILDVVPSASEETYETVNIHEVEGKTKGINTNGDSINYKDNNKKLVLNREKNINISNLDVLKGAIFFIGLIFIFKIIFLKYKHRKIMEDKSIIPLYLYIKHRLEYLDIIKPENQGALEFYCKIEDSGLRECMIKLCNIVYEETYGDKYHTLYKSELKEPIYMFIEEYIKKQQGIIRYSVCKFFTY
ncbi:transglutaminase-like domain-containing protein [Clostridium rectalis]|uniref:transglutaminase-like domain-containing protein n=1 Tax=Clostridium rectalis TaxID=2040295 RepID=UPI000F62D166|nr:transglutaminase-like domain-containing protein [Clostridium rectalis]